MTIEERVFALERYAQALRRDLSLMRIQGEKDRMAASKARAADPEVVLDRVLAEVRELRELIDMMIDRLAAALANRLPMPVPVRYSGRKRRTKLMQQLEYLEQRVGKDFCSHYKPEPLPEPPPGKPA